MDDLAQRRIREVLRADDPIESAIAVSVGGIHRTGAAADEQTLAGGFQLPVCFEDGFRARADILIVVDVPQGADDEFQVAVVVPIDEKAMVVAVVVLAAL